jgi:hypothetical protein
LFLHHDSSRHLHSKVDLDVISIRYSGPTVKRKWLCMQRAVSRVPQSCHCLVATTWNRSSWVFRKSTLSTPQNDVVSL